MAPLYSAAPIHYSPVRRQQHLPGPGVVPVVIHGTTYYCQHPPSPQSHLRQSLTNSLANPSPAAPDPVYLSVAQSRPVTSSVAYSYSTSNINHAKSQNQGIYFHGDRNRRKQNSRPPRMFNRGPLNNTTNGKYPSSPSHFLLATPSAPQFCCGGAITLLCSLGREKEAPGIRLSSQYRKGWLHDVDDTPE